MGASERKRPLTTATAPKTYCRVTVSLDPLDSKGALDALTGRIICVCLLIDDGTQVTEVALAGDDERELLTGFWRLVEPTDVMVGHNVIEFDIPFSVSVAGLTVSRLHALLTSDGTTPAP